MCAVGSDTIFTVHPADEGSREATGTRSDMVQSMQGPGLGVLSDRLITKQNLGWLPRIQWR